MTSSKTIPDRLGSELLREDPDLRDLVEEFVGTLALRFSELETAYRQNDWESATRLAHRLKGAGGSYGYPLLTEVAALLEHDLRHREAAHVERLLEHLQSVVKSAQAGLWDEET